MQLTWGWGGWWVHMFMKGLKCYLEEKLKFTLVGIEGLPWEQGSDPVRQDTWVGSQAAWSSSILPAAPLWQSAHWCCCCCSVVKSCPALCDSMNCSTPGFPVLHYLPEFAQTCVHLSRWCHPTTSPSVVPFTSCLQSFPASGSFPVSWLFASDGQSIGWAI